MTARAAARAQVDFEQVFDRMPGLCLVLDIAFTIVAQNEEHARVTKTMGGSILGQSVFAAFPDNPDDSSVNGVSLLRASLLKVLKLRQPDVLALRYDIKQGPGRFEVRHWSVTNVPILGEDGYVQWILIRAEQREPQADRMKS